LRGGRLALRVTVAVLVGTLILPLADGGSAARAAWDRSVEVTPRQSRGVTPMSEAEADADALAQKHDRMDGAMASLANAAAGRSGLNPIDVARARDIGLVGGRMVRVIVESTGPRSRAVSAVRAVGGAVEAEYENLVQAVVAPGMLERLAADPAVDYVREPLRSEGSAVTDEGVAVSGATVWQASSIAGHGLKVGIVDSTFTGYQTRQAQGDLPADLTVVDLCNGQVTSQNDPHGAAVAEIVYEMAPGIQLYLLCYDTDVQYGQAKDYAKANGISLIVSSISWLNTGRGDGSGGPSTINGIVADARANGILWVNSAGNYAQRHYSATFTDPDVDGAHNYTPTDEGNTIFLNVNQRSCVFLRWDSWPTTNQDFDLRLVRSGTTEVVASSSTRQTGAQSPRESFCYTNTTGTAQNFFIVVLKFSATTNPFFELFTFGSSPVFEYQVAAGSIAEPASSPNVMGVGAICWQNDRRETYSSQGPTIDGRIKPDIAGQSVVSSGSFGPFISCPAAANGQGGFNGTSAASPHVGGAAALVKWANPSFTAAQVQAFLEGRATDLDTPGKDNLFGAGKLQLGGSPLGAVACEPRPPVTLQTAVGGGRRAVTLQIAGANNRLIGVAFANGLRVPINALIDLPDGRTGLTGTPSWFAPSILTGETFWIKRQTTTDPITVPFIVTDRCGTWPTFVGGGTGPTAAGY
jgi:hypothetical protein